MNKGKRKWQVVFCGVGGQGLVLDGFLLGEAAGLFENRQATMVMTYGAESRGTFTKADVIVDEEKIDFPEVVEPDVVVALAQVAYDRYIGKMTAGSIIIYDNAEIIKGQTDAMQYGYPISRIATEAGGLLTANLTAMGILVAITGLVREDSVIQAIENRFKSKPEMVKRNIRSFKEGIKNAQAHPVR